MESIRRVNIYAIEGNIGTGKSTLLAELKEIYKDKTNMCFLDEPIEIWNKIIDKNEVTILEKYYENISKYAFSFQMMALISRITSLKNALKNTDYDVIIMERSIFTDCNVFAQMLYDDNKIEEIEYIIYKQWYNDLIAEIPPILFIYLRTEPTISLKRINKRNRKGETISLEYIENCHKYHDNWLVNNSKVKILNSNEDELTNKFIIDSCKNFIDLSVLSL